MPVRLALALIERDLVDGPIRIIAACVSPVPLRTLFHQATGRVPHRCVQSRRIAPACRLLRGADAPVAEVAAWVGIAEPRVFHRWIKAFTGTAPGCWC